MSTGPGSVSTPPPPALRATLDAAIAAHGGWLPFDRYMAIVLYAPGLGYYSRDDRQIGRWTHDGSDFVTAPELSPLFARALAVQLAQALDATGTDEVWEFGAGRGTLAAQLLDALGDRVRCYHVVELSAALAARQRATLAGHGDRVRWHSALPDAIAGVVVGNEVLDAMPVRLLVRGDGGGWLERGVSIGVDGTLVWRDRPTDAEPALDPAVDAADFAPGSLTEIHPQGEAFVRTIAATLTRGAAFFIDYGFPAAEYHHPQRRGGTLMCHRGHRADPDPLSDPGAKDITAHVDFSAIALAGQDAGLSVLGYTSQARFLLNCGFAAALAAVPLAARADAQRLLHEHEMGELFKVIGFVAGPPFDAVGFAVGDRTHRL